MKMDILNKEIGSSVWFLRMWRYDTRTITNKTESGLN